MGIEEKIKDWPMFGKNPQHTAYVNVELNPKKMVLIRPGIKMSPYKEPEGGFLVFKNNAIQRVSGLPNSATLDDIEVSTSWDSITAINTKNKKPLEIKASFARQNNIKVPTNRTVTRVLENLKDAGFIVKRKTNNKRVNINSRIWLLNSSV